MNLSPDLCLRVLRHASALPEGQAIAPEPDPGSLVGFSYPGLKEALGDSASFDTMVLKKLEEDGLLAGEFVDRVQLCPHCMSYNICFRDICPACGSANIAAVKMLHHFPCGHVDREGAFQRQGRCLCPKCGEQIFVPGRDYESVPDNFLCQACSWGGQATIRRGLCVACGQGVDAHKTVPRDIMAYRVSDVGRQAAASGVLPPERRNNQLEAAPLAAEAQDFGDLSKLSTVLALTNQYGKIASDFKQPLAALSVSPDVVAAAGPSVTKPIADAFAAKLARQARALLRGTDLLAVTGGGGLFVVMPQTSARQARGLGEKLLAAVAAAKFPGAFSRTTLSVGVAEWEKPYRDATELMTAAIGARHKAISRGGNQVCVN